MSFLLRRAWLIRSTIQSNRALYRDLAMESRAVTAYGHRGVPPSQALPGLCVLTRYVAQWSVPLFLFDRVSLLPTLASSDSPASASQAAGSVGVRPSTWLLSL